MEINPVDQSGVERRHQRDVASRSINVRGVWDRAVDAWLEEDLAELDAIWDQIIEDIAPSTTRTATSPPSAGPPE
ncbi:hypothetical protein [Streptomyces sp. bgisy091]|uniref:hypothetical protein n=1 Tax=Streptomyces sp. bgisy091 TaxID=3413778 RepID=UPI003D759401